MSVHTDVTASSPAQLDHFKGCLSAGGAGEAAVGTYSVRETRIAAPWSTEGHPDGQGQGLGRGSPF